MARQVLEALRRLHDPLSHAFGTGSAARHDPLEELAAPEPAPDSDTAMSGVPATILAFWARVTGRGSSPVSRGAWQQSSWGILLGKPITVLSDESTVVVWGRFQGTRKGRTFETFHVYYYRFDQDGRMIEGHTIPVDQHLADQFWT